MTKHAAILHFTRYIRWVSPEQLEELLTLSVQPPQPASRLELDVAVGITEGLRALVRREMDLREEAA